jgi:hypothetical protein
MDNKILVNNLYQNLKLYNIDSKTKIKIISDTYQIDRSTIFRWINDAKSIDDNINYNITTLKKYYNSNITYSVESLIINNIDKYKSINKLKKFINNTLKTCINNNIIKCVMASNNLKMKNFNNIDISKLIKIDSLNNTFNNISKHIY